MVTRREAPGSLTIAEVLATAFPAYDAGARRIDVPVHVIPQGTEPRWVVIGDPRPAGRVLASWRPFKISTRLRWSAVVGCARLGALAHLPGVISLRNSIDLGYWLRALGGLAEDCVPVLHIGNSSSTRKVTVFVAGQDGRIKAVAKAPLREGAAQAILNEAEVLRQLGESDFHPRSVFEDRERGIAAQSWLEGEPVGRELTPAHIELLARFAVAGCTVRLAGQRASIAADLERDDLPFDRDVLARALDLLDDDRPLPAFVEHRDFAPWNLKRLPNGATGAIDWEWAVLRSLPCQDLFRYFYIQDALFNGPGDVWQRLNRHPLVKAHLHRFDIPADALLGLAMHYQLRVLAADWQSGNRGLAEYAYSQVASLLELKSVPNSLRSRAYSA